MKILHVTQNYYPSVGGTQYMMQKISESLNQLHNDDVTVYTSNSFYGPNRKQFKKIELEEETINNVRAQRFRYSRLHMPLIRIINLICSRLFKKQLPEYLNNLSHGPLSTKLKHAVCQTNADVICASSMQYLFADYPLWVKATKRRKPFVLYGAMHLHNVVKLPSSYLKRVEICDYYIANTRFEKQFLCDKGVPGDKIIVIGAATDVHKHQKVFDKKKLLELYHLSENDIVVLLLCRMEMHKGLGLIPSILLKLEKEHPNIKLIAAGSQGSATEMLLQAQKDYNNIKVVVGISEEEKKELLFISDIVALPSSEESFGVVFLEGWAFNKPVIGAKTGAISSVISDGIDGLLFDPNNSDDLYNMIVSLCNNATLRQTMGVNGFNKVMKNYTWEVTTKKFREVYLMAIDKHKRQLNGR